MASEMEIDDSLYSRQRYVLGDSAMKRMAQSSVLIYGLGGLGVEIAKNIVLAGVKCLTVQDAVPCTLRDLGTQFFVRQADVDSSKNRAEACAGKLAELNPYVKISTRTEALTLTTDLTYLQEFQCIILTECPLSVQLYVNKFCRACPTPIKFVSSDVFGVFSSAFCDFGDSFEVADPTGEESKEVFIAKITKANPGVVTSLDNQLHGLETGDVVTFKEVKGMEQINSLQCEVKVLSPTTFSIGDTSGSGFGQYVSGGIMKQLKVPKTVHFKSLEDQLMSPTLLMADLSKFTAPMNIHLAFQALHQFWTETGNFPQPWCSDSADRMVALAKACSANIAAKNQAEPEELDEKLVRCLSHTAAGCLSPLCAAMGGVVAQEGLKALTGKFLPLSQWLYLDGMEAIPDLSSTCPESFQQRNDRLDPLRICVGQEVCQKLADARLFMVGCGAIGCEMLKNYALLGVGSSQKGQITITDNDLIEKSNLNRQFLFRPHHIQKPKSTTAAQAVLEINSALHIEAQQHKVCPQTETTNYPDAFYEAQDVMVNALDNLEARRYMDSRCVTNQRPLLESGTMGTKGHVQVIVPHLTESYTSQQDPADEDFPYCTVKSFPANIEHCIQWARDKFEELFVHQPNLFNKFLASNADINAVVHKLKSGDIVDGGLRVSKMAAARPRCWEDCVRLARLRFEKYFNHKAQQLIHAFPLDTKLPDNSLFWQSPKRPPGPVQFNADDPQHLTFITSTTRLLCDIYGIPGPQVDVNSVKTQVQMVTVPQFIPSNKKIETDESKGRADEQLETTSDEVTAAGERLAHVVMSPEAQAGNLKHCQNYRTISLISHPSKVMLRVLLNRLKGKKEEILAEEQAGFISKRSTVKQIFNIRILIKKHLQHQRDLFHNFIDFKKAFDRVWHDDLWQVMRNYIIDSNIIDVIKVLYDDSKSSVLLNNQIGKFFRTTMGVRQGCLLSPVLFNIYLENIMTEALSGFQPSISINGRPVCNLRFADDIDLKTGTEKEVQDRTTRLETRSKAFGMEVSDEKGKTHLSSTSYSAVVNIKMNGQILEEVDGFKYLASIITKTGSPTKGIRTKLSLASTAMTKPNTIWKSNTISLPVNIKSFVISILLYGCESWTLNAKTEWWLQALEHKCYRKLLCIHYSEHKTNEYVRQRIDTLAGKQEPQLSVVKRRKLTWFGHVNRHDSLAKTILQGIVEGGRRRSRQSLKPMLAVEFEKDDDSNEHINFIAACSNIRAQMYSIESADRLKVKRIAGRIVPAIATTTAAVSGLVTLELLKVLQQRPLEFLKNAFLNLALPMLLLSEPGACARKVLKEGLSVSVWDKWTIQGTKDFTLQQFLNSCKENFGFEATAVVNGVKIIYMPIMPPHKKRLPQTMMKLIKPEPGCAYVDLVVCFENDKEEEIEGPPVRYFFGN
ncbi:hypothetical protein ACOMHN_048067 [Nucella lapillus]